MDIISTALINIQYIKNNSGVGKMQIIILPRIRTELNI